MASKRVLYIREQELTDIQGRDFQIECPDMSLHQIGAEAPNVYSGSGEILVDGGRVSFRLFHPSKGSDVDRYGHLKRLFAAREGQLVPEDHYFRLIGTDIEGRNWTCDRLYAHPIMGSHGGGVVRGSLPWVKYAVAEGCESTSFVLCYEGKLQTPYNATTSTRTKTPIGGSFSGRRNALEFSADDGQVTILGGEEITRFFVRSTNRDLEKASRYVHEAVLFMEGRPARRSFVQLFATDSQSLTIFSFPPEAYSSLLQPPIDTRADPRDFSTLFVKYLRFLSRAGIEDDHPLTQELQLLSRSTSTADYALAISVAIERILRELFSDVGNPSPAELDEIDRIINHLPNWRSGEEVETLTRDQAELLLTRATSSIRQLKNWTPANCIRELISSGVLQADALKHWNELRHPVAHDRPGKIELQELVDLSYRATVLFYHVIFHAMGYAGAYTDYSRDRWPLKRYPAEINSLKS